MKSTETSTAEVREHRQVPKAVETHASVQPTHGADGAGVMSDESVAPYNVAIPQRDLDDLRRRLAETRWPDVLPQRREWPGVPLARMQSLVDYWQTRYDWRRLENEINRLPQFRTTIDGLEIHFFHVRSKHDGARPLLLTHGWPGSFVEFLDLIGPLVDPTAHAGTAREAFHVIIPSLPGFAFSGKPSETGWGVKRVSGAWSVLMHRLGYADWLAQGGDFGAAVATWMASQGATGLRAIHLNFPLMFPPPIEGQPDEDEQAAIDEFVRFDSELSAFAKLQVTRPQTIGYSLDDSPVGLAAWIYEKFIEWTDSKSDPESVISRDRLLDNITLYWLTRSGSSSAQIYRESFQTEFMAQKLSLPVAVSLFPGELFHPPKQWGERMYSQLVHWGNPSAGGHFAALEQPLLFAEELRRAFARVR